MVVKIGGRRMWMWRAVDDEGEMLDVLVQKRRNRHAAMKLLRKFLRNQGIHPQTITTDKLASYRAALQNLGLTDRASSRKAKPSASFQLMEPSTTPSMFSVTFSPAPPS